MRVIIAGSRSIKGGEAVALIDKAVKEAGWEIDEVISGDAPGVDTAAIEWAKLNDIDVVIMPANWKKWPNKSAGYKRNQKMAWYAGVIEKNWPPQPKDDTHWSAISDKYKGGLLAIWNGKSSGTSHMIDIAKEAGLKCFIHEVKDGK